MPRGIEYPDAGTIGELIALIKLICPISDPEKDFITHHSYLQRNRTFLAKLALEYYRLKDNGRFDQVIEGVNLLGDKSWVPQNGPIDLQLGESAEIELEMDYETPAHNTRVYATGYLRLPWGDLYSKNVEELCRQYNEKLKPPPRLRARFFDDPLYQLLEFSHSGSGYKIKCCRNSYYSYVDHCELLHYEFARAIYRQFVRKNKKPTVKQLNTRKLRFRENVDLCNASDRCMGIGINTLFLMKSDNKFTFFKHKRGRATIEAVNTEHVVPAGTFAPRRGIPQTHDPDFNIYKNILRELGEELLGRKDFEKVRNSVRDVTEDEKVKKYHELFKDGHAAAFFLGCGVDPLTTKAEFLTAIVLDLKEYKRRFGKEAKFKHNWEGKHYHFKFSEEEIEAFVKGPFTLPAGAGCAQLAWKHRDLLLKSIG